MKMGVIDPFKPGVMHMAEQMMIMEYIYPEKTGFQKMIYDTSSGKVLGLHHVVMAQRIHFHTLPI